MFKKVFEIIKKGWVFVLVIGIFSSIYLVLVLNCKITLIGDKQVNVNIYDDYFENGYVATLFEKKIDGVIVSDNINTQEMGDYEVKYQYNLLLPIKIVIRKVSVLDMENPNLELLGDETVYITKTGTYNEEGYKASDNYDGDLTDKVIVEGFVDTNKEGKYLINYLVSDSSGNKISKTRTVEVRDTDLLSVDIDEFWMKGYFSDVILKPDDIEYDFFKDTVFIGDSNTYFMYKFGEHISKEQCWGRRGNSILNCKR